MRFITIIALVPCFFLSLVAQEGELVSLRDPLFSPIVLADEIAAIAKEAGLEFYNWQHDSEAALIKAAIDADAREFGLTPAIRERYAALFRAVKQAQDNTSKN